MKSEKLIKIIMKKKRLLRTVVASKPEDHLLMTDNQLHNRAVVVQVPNSTRIGILLITIIKVTFRSETIFKGRGKR